MIGNNHAAEKARNIACQILRIGTRDNLLLATSRKQDRPENDKR
jgi:hypothetical protein